MEWKRAEKAREQQYFDAAAKHRQRHFDNLGRAAEVAANTGAAQRIKKQVERGQIDLDEAVAFGRIDTSDAEKLYIGRRLIRDDQGNVLVINWQAPAADRYHKANRADPLGVTRKRTYECSGNVIRDFSDVTFFGEEDTDAFLTRVLGQARTGAMRDIVATIQAAQFDVISQRPNQVLVIEGGPGTGKTAIALHRVSWLLHRYPELAGGGVLVVGPNRTFMRYIGGVLPGLGDEEVELRAVHELAPSLRRGRAEAEDVSRLKGDPRMAELLARALEARIGEPETVERLHIDGRFVSVPGADIAPILVDCRQRNLPYAERRRAFRDRLIDLVGQRAGRSVNPAAVGNLVERIWPQQAPAAFLRDLLGSRTRLAAAASGILADVEVAKLYRRGTDRLSEEVWADADLPLLDELDALINGVGRRYAYIVADEAQDLSPMQLRSLGRRSATGNMTVVGDIAQSTGAWARESWDDVTLHLSATQDTNIVALRYGYRVPRQAYEFASRLLQVAAPEMRPPEVVRDGPWPTVHSVELTERGGRSVAVAQAHAAEGRFVGIICPTRCRSEIEAALSANGVDWSSADRGELGAAINLVSSQEAKGLEFDAVVVVEPEYIVAEHQRGHRMLYVALTRTTGYLDIVCVGEALPLAVTRAFDDGLRDPDATFDQRDIARLADLVASQIRNAAPETSWPTVVDEVRRRVLGSEL